MSSCSSGLFREPVSLSRLFLAGIVLMGGVALPAAAQRFLPDDPLWTDPDRMDMPLPSPRRGPDRIGPIAFLDRTFMGGGATLQPAVNVNTVGGVPNSSWYTNRHYRYPLSLAALRRGPNTEPGPVMNAPWRLVRTEGDGPLPLAVVQDATGRRFRLLFDAAAHPEMATGAAMIGSRLLHALGYNVPQHWLRYIRADRLVPAADSVTQGDVDSLLAGTTRRPDRTYRVLVTRVSGVVRRIGPFRFRGTRADDANDVFPHQHRRELRGLRIFAAWMNHSKVRPRHTLDVGVEEDGRRFVRHYLTGLHLTLGSGGAKPKEPWSGHEHVLEVTEVLERVATLGLSGGDWAETEPPNWPALGRFGTEGFEPRQWRPEWPNPAFQRCDSSDAFWAAKQVRHFSRADLAAIVGAADYSSPSVTNRVTVALVRRRNAIARAYLGWGGGLARFEVQGRRLIFDDLPARYGLASTGRRRAVTWHVFDNQQERVGQQLARTQSDREAIIIPSSSAAFLRGTLRTPTWGTTRVFLRRTAATRQQAYEVVGIERKGPGPSQF